MTIHWRQAGLVRFCLRSNPMEFRSGPVVKAPQHSRVNVLNRHWVAARGFAVYVATLLVAAYFFVPVLWAQTGSGSPKSGGAQTEQFENAVAYYQKILAGSPPRTTEVETRTRLAMAYFMLHRYDESLQAIQPLTTAANVSAKAPARSDVPAQAWTVQGLDYLELNRLPEAITSLQRALATNPSAGTARPALGDA